MFIESPAVEAEPGDHSSLDLKLSLFRGFLNGVHMCVPAARQCVFDACTHVESTNTKCPWACMWSARRVPGRHTFADDARTWKKKGIVCMHYHCLESKGSQEKSWMKIFHCNFSSRFSFSPSSIFVLGWPVETQCSFLFSFCVKCFFFFSKQNNNLDWNPRKSVI